MPWMLPQHRHQHCRLPELDDCFCCRKSRKENILNEMNILKMR